MYLCIWWLTGPGAFSAFGYVIEYNYVNVCPSHTNKPFTYLLFPSQLVFCERFCHIPRNIHSCLSVK